MIYDWLMSRGEKNRATESAVNALLRVLENASEGLTRAEAQRRAGLDDASSATVRRWLHELIDSGRVRSEGETKSRRYLAVRMPASAVTSHLETDGIVPVSVEGESVRRQVTQPISSRRPNSYIRGFLDSYRPNETFYLPAGMRRHLMELGRTTTTPQPGGTYARQILQRLLIDLSWNSSRLEGNTYSLLDTERLLVEDMAASGKGPVEKQMILNHKAAIEWVVGVVGDGPPRIRASLLCNLHALLMENLVGDPADEGRVRSRPVQIGGSTFIPLAIPQQIQECLTQVALVADAITDPFEQSFFFLVHLPYLQPFIDGNKRTARLAANLPLIRENLRPLTFVDVEEKIFVEAVLGVYELRRVELLRDVFAWSYERSCARYSAIQQSLGEPDPFRLAHRVLIKDTVAALVRGGHSAEDIDDALAPFAERLPASERPRFQAVVETELRGLHDGNFGRLGLRPSEFEAWVQALAAAQPSDPGGENEK